MAELIDTLLRSLAKAEVKGHVVDVRDEQNLVPLNFMELSKSELDFFGPDEAWQRPGTYEPHTNAGGVVPAQNML